MNALRAVTMLVVAVAFAACDGVGIEGTGTSRTEAREVAVFHRVEVSGALDVKLTDRDPATVAVTADDNLVGHVTTQVTEGVLRVEPKDGVRLFSKVPVTIEVSWKTLNEAGASGASSITGDGIVCERVALATSGASRIALDNVTGTELVLWASGASEITLGQANAEKASLQLSGASKVEVKSGSLKGIEAEVSGASQAKLGGVTSETASLNISGASEVDLSASQSVTGTASGASSVKVKGNPAERALGTSGGSDVRFE